MTRKFDYKTIMVHLGLIFAMIHMIWKSLSQVNCFIFKFKPYGNLFREPRPRIYGPRIYGSTYSDG